MKPTTAARPLAGRRILVTRSRTQAEALSAELAGLGAEVLKLPTIRIIPPEDWGPLDEALDELPRFDWVVFTSANGVKAVVDRLLTRPASGGLRGSRLCAIGPATAACLQAFELKADLIPPTFVGEAIVDALRSQGELQGRRILLPRSEKARPFLGRALEALGALVTEVVAYRTLPEVTADPGVLAALERGAVDCLTFTSSSTVTHFIGLIGRERARQLSQAVPVASIGPITTRTAREAGLRVWIQAREYTIPGLVEAIVAFYRHPASGGSA